MHRLILAIVFLPLICFAQFNPYGFHNTSGGDSGVQIYNGTTNTLWVDVSDNSGQYYHPIEGGYAFDQLFAPSHSASWVGPGETFYSHSAGIGADPSSKVLGSVVLHAYKVGSDVDIIPTIVFSGIGHSFVDNTGHWEFFAGDTVIAGFLAYADAPQNCVTNVTVTAVNNNPDWRIFGIIKKNGTQTAGQLIAPGQTFTFSVDEPCEDAAQGWPHVGMSLGNGNDDLTDTGVGPNKNGNLTGDTNGVSNVSNPTNLPPIYGGTNLFTAPTPSVGVPQSNILWSAGSVPPSGASDGSKSVVQTLKDANSVLHDDIVKAANQAHNDAQAIKNALTNNSGSGGSSVTINGTNLNLSLTNYNLETTQTKILNALTNSESDLAFTNIPGDGSNVVSYVLSPSDTNGNAALSAARDAFGSEFADKISNATNLAGGFLNQNVPDGVEPNMMLNLSEIFHDGNLPDLDLNPVHHVGWAFEFIHAFFTFLTVLYFTRSVLDCLEKALTDYATAQTGGVPNMVAPKS